MRSEEEILAELRDLDWSTLSGSTEEWVRYRLRKELQEWRDANPSLLDNE